MSKYDMLVSVLDGIRREAVGTKYTKLYAVGSADAGETWQARSRAYIHLYLKVKFGLLDFEQREVFVTDGPGDGGIDGYFIDQETRTVYLIQAKFRTTAENFENKPIQLDEILAMEIDRVLGGETTGFNGERYNGKISGLQRRVNEIYDLGRYKYEVVLLANLTKVMPDALKRLTDGKPAEVVNFERAYMELLYPVVTGDLFSATETNIHLDVSNKTIGTKIGYAIRTHEYDGEITVVFVPVIEIARLMSKYKNSILRYNPRNYLDFEGGSANQRIRDTALSLEVNDFALLNNGITIICDSSSINDQSGTKNRGRLFLANPQIINGGQTAYTLSRIYEDTPPEQRESLLAGKEVLIKAISITKKGDTPEQEFSRIALIERISTATNSQAAVTSADRTADEPALVLIQRALFQKYGLLYERKRGEFSEGLRSQYFGDAAVVDRPTFARLYFLANDRPTLALAKKIMTVPLGDDVTRPGHLEAFVLAYYIFEFLRHGKLLGQKAYGHILPQVYAALIAARCIEGTLEARAQEAARLVDSEWPAFLTYGLVKKRAWMQRRVSGKGRVAVVFNASRRIFKGTFVSDVMSVFQQHPAEVRATLAIASLSDEEVEALSALPDISA